MKRLILATILPVLVASLALGQTTEVPADAKPSKLNVPGGQFPKIDSQGRAYFRISARNATNVSVSLQGGNSFKKGDDGVWTGVTAPLAPGFHYYMMRIDGVEAADPATDSFFGSGHMSSAVEVPAPDEDFYQPKNVPHGEIRARYYLAKSTGLTRRAFIYTPPDYDSNLSARYPVLYLQHGMGEDARGWSQQGYTGFIMDNLLAEGKVKPMLIVMDDGGIAAGMGGGGGGRGAGGPGGPGGFGGRRGGAPGQTNAAGTNAAPPMARGAGGPPGMGGGRGMGGRGGGGGGMGGEFTQVLVEDIIPMVDSTYRTVADRKHRAMAGLSLGGTQTWNITQSHLDLFANIAAFSAPFGYPGVPDGYNGLFGKPEEFSKQVDVLFFSMGTAGDMGSGKQLDQQLTQAGIKHVYYESPGTAHEWLTWRRSLHEFLPLLFKNDTAAK